MNTEKLKKLICQKGKSQREIANELGIISQRFNNYVTGIREPDVETLILLAKYFGVSVDYLTGNVDSTQLDMMEYPTMIKYRGLDDERKRIADEMLDYLFDKKNLAAISSDMLESIKKSPPPENEDGLDSELLRMLSCFTPSETQRIVDFAKGLAASHGAATFPDK